MKKLLVALGILLALVSAAFALNLYFQWVYIPLEASILTWIIYGVGFASLLLLFWAWKWSFFTIICAILAFLALAFLFFGNYVLDFFPR